MKKGQVSLDVITNFKFGSELPSNQSKKECIVIYTITIMIKKTAFPGAKENKRLFLTEF